MLDANQCRLLVPIVPYHDYGGGQAPLGALLPHVFSSSSASSQILPTYPPVAVQPIDTHYDDSVAAPAASTEDSRPIVSIPTQHKSHDAGGQAPKSSAIEVEGCHNNSDELMRGRKPAVAAAGTFFGLFTFSQVYQNIIFPKITPPSELLEEKHWVASSHSWLDRKVCNWFGFCGLTHLNQNKWTDRKKGSHRAQEWLQSIANAEDKVDLKSFWTSATTTPEDWSDEERILREIPKYVLEHAPYIHLYSGEQFWPCDIAEHLIHTTPHLNYTPVQASSDHPNLTNLDDLNEWGRFLYLQSDDNVEERPDWLGGEANIPARPGDSDEDLPDWDDQPEDHIPDNPHDDVQDWWDAGIGDTIDKGGFRPAPGAPVPVDTDEGEELVDGKDKEWQPELTRRKLGREVVGGRSDAPAVLIVVDKGEGIVDAFWFFFYSYNLGNTVFNVRFGNHVGDWEHTVIRFKHGKPKAVFFSEHSFGEAYSWDAVEKKGKRPVGYSATGTHAMYATPGTHPYILPGGILHDETDRGPLWDPLLNVHSFTYDYRNDTLRSSNITPQAPTGWFYFIGHWGDKFYPLSDPRQYRFVGQYHYVNGPLGPRFKNLGRKQICQGNNECLLKTWIGPKRGRRRLERYPSAGEGEEMSEEDVRRFVGPEW